jgi:small nuclear ribonucleoprotein (snRNP)-like protein
MEHNPIDEIKELLEQIRSRLQKLLTGNGHSDPSQSKEPLIRHFETLLIELNLEEKFIVILNSYLDPINCLLQNSTEKLSESNHFVFLISILVLISIKQLNIQGLTKLEEEITMKLKEISSLNFDLVNLFIDDRLS